MFGSKKRDRRKLGLDGTEPAKVPTKRDRVGSAMYTFFGPATVEGAIQGHSPEARQAWKDLLENNKRARAEAKRQEASGNN
jgi:hypothetical protein